MKETLKRLKADGKALVSCVIDWDRVRNDAMTYCQRKKDEHCFDGKRIFDMGKAATYNLIEGKETVL